MGAVHIRNVYADYVSSAQFPEKNGLFLMREMFIAGGWQIIDTSADAGWTDSANVLLELSDFAVTTAEGRKITSTTGGFDSTHIGQMITLEAANTDVRGLYNISNVESNALYLSARTCKPSWPVDESGISGKIHKAAKGLDMGASAYFVMQAPAASGHDIQVHFRHDSYDSLIAKIYPWGDYGGAATASQEIDVGSYYSAFNYSRWNAYFADPLASEFYATIIIYGQGGDVSTWTFGILTDTAAGDTGPGFMHHCTTNFDSLSNEPTMYMVNEAGTPTLFYPAYFKGLGSYDDSNKREQYPGALRLNNGRLKRFRPLVAGQDTTDGGFIRGRDPRSYCNSYYSNYNEFGTDWWKMDNHFLLPRDGADDVLPSNDTSPSP